MLFIGLTGSIAVGKSTVAKIFESIGCYIIDADELAHKVYEKGTEAYDKILKLFPKSILDSANDIDRKKLGNIVLNNKEALQRLEFIVHPEIEKIRQKEIDKIKNKSKNPIIIYDVPLLLEKHMEDMFDYIIVVYADKEKEINRLMNREKLTKKEAKKRIELQIPIEQKVKRADFVIDNSGSLENTTKQIKQILLELRKKNNERN